MLIIEEKFASSDVSSFIELTFSDVIASIVAVTFSIDFSIGNFVLMLATEALPFLPHFT